MEGLLYIVMLACLGLVSMWYVVNEHHETDGDEGLLGVRPDVSDDETSSAYSVSVRSKDSKPETIEKERVRAAAQPMRQRAASFRARGEGAYKASYKKAHRHQQARFIDQPRQRGPDTWPEDEE